MLLGKISIRSPHNFEPTFKINCHLRHCLIFNNKCHFKNKSKQPKIIFQKMEKSIKLQESSSFTGLDGSPNDSDSDDDTLKIDCSTPKIPKKRKRKR